MFMASCFCAYVRKMKELEILPLLSFNIGDANKNNFEAIKGLMEMTSPLTYAKKKNITETILEFGNGDNTDIIEEEYGNVTTPEEQGIFHTPFFFEQ